MDWTFAHLLEQVLIDDLTDFFPCQNQVLSRLVEKKIVFEVKNC
jgi:hypothetical protein